ncbi:uncharacterized protein LOC120275531 [Dioscorea cayenensis subsp. rotundata]|uniref:ceramide glucosyltransferase n=1 Tax=Dioscorea cayennensis subsp. rotundata TaxID=55577 RepID=A0AB40CE51_DIOCR|nr:uncharacterized protein LOC120275531 [Dioscorea cayenensis subsp. rotundata]
MLDINIFSAEKGFDSMRIRESQYCRFTSVKVIDEIISFAKEWQQCMHPRLPLFLALWLTLLISILVKKDATEMINSTNGNKKLTITSLYGGLLEFLFVVESIDDPAYHAISSLISEFKKAYQTSTKRVALPSLVTLKFHPLLANSVSLICKDCVAGLSTTWSQKIHNQLFGAEKMHKGSKYVLFLDDDVRLHLGSVGALTAEMEKIPEIFIQTGYPLDLPSGSLGSYCIYEYDMPCSMGFATSGKTFFLWSGYIMMHADDFRKDSHGVVSGLRDGGYFDDMTLAAIASNFLLHMHDLKIHLFLHAVSEISKK